MDAEGESEVAGVFHRGSNREMMDPENFDDFVKSIRDYLLIGWVDLVAHVDRI